MAAKAYVKRKTVGKYSAKKRTGGRYGKKTKKVGTSVAIKTLIAGEVQKVMSNGLHNEKRKIIMDLSLANASVMVNGKEAMKNCIRIPITAAIPTLAGAQSGPDVRRRTSNKIVVTGVNVRASFSVSEETRVMVMAYEPHDTVRKQLDAVPVEIRPSAAMGHVPEGWSTQLVNHHAMGLVSKHGPLMTKKSGTSIAMDTVDNTVFECRTASHSGRPVGAVFRKKFGGGLSRTVNWNQGPVEEVGAGHTAWKIHTVNEYWKLGKEYTYMYEGSNELTFDRSLEMMMYVDCPSLQASIVPEEIPLVGALIRNVVVDIYYHDK